MSGLTQEDKLRALGIKQASSQENPLSGSFEQLRNAVEWDTFKDDVLNDLTGFDEFEDYLVDEAEFEEEGAETLRDRIEAKYESWDDLQDDVDDADSYGEWEGEFRFGTSLTGDTLNEDGENNAGIRIHGEGGVSQAGVTVPAGTVEIYGPRIEFSQTDSTIDDPSTAFNVSNLQVSDTVPTLYETITISAQIENESGYSTSFTAKLTEDGDKVDSKTLSFDVDETRTVEFERTYMEYKSVDVKINDAGPETVSVVQSGIANLDT